jgi:sigma-B regulation protein RsbU (phosphoserine phosphatase)
MLFAPPETQFLLASSAKRAFRAAESLLADLSFRNEEELLHAALERVAESLDFDFPAFVLTRRGQLFLPPEEAALLRREPSVYRHAPSLPSFWSIGFKHEWLVRWTFRRELSDSDLLSLEAARLVISQKLAEASLTGILHQAAAIQGSLLPDPVPSLNSIEAAARSLAAESVGGDVFDVLELSPEALGFTIADASGHGLPAALQARDVIVGLRMGAARHMKISAAVERLNDILCRSSLSSRFVSLVYGELDEEGVFQFVNAGHPYPILVNPRADEGDFVESDIVLGVSPRVRYRTFHGQLKPGGVLVLITDGILEGRSPAGEEFGAERLAALARSLAARSAAEILEEIFQELERHTRRQIPADDATALVFRRV